MKKVPNPKYIELNQKLQSLKPFNRNLPDGSVDDSNGGLPRPWSTIPSSPLVLLLPPPRSVFNVPFLPTVPQLESKTSQLPSEPTAKQQQQEQLVKLRQ